jgi:hypothetical protein
MAERLSEMYWLLGALVVIAGWGVGILHGLAKTVRTLAEDVGDLRNGLRDIRSVVNQINDHLPERDDEGL